MSAARILFAAAAIVIAGGAPLAADQLGPISPAAPTWRDRAQVTVTGTAPGGCGASLSYLAAGNRFTVDLAVSFDCTIPLPTSYPFALVADLPPLEPGIHTVRLTDGAPLPTRRVLEQRTLQVYEVANVAIELPSFSTVDHPGSLRLTWLAGAGTPAASVEVDGDLILVQVSSPASFYPPTQLATLDVPLPPLAAGRHEVRVLFPGFGPQTPPRLVRSALHVLRAAGCVPDAQTLCLHDGRFRLSGSWRDFIGRTGAAHAAPLQDNDGSGLLWFFAPDNAELTVKVLDACTISGRWWTFVSSSSTVEYTLTVTDTATGRTRIYGNDLGQVPRLIADTEAFPCAL